MNSFDVFFIKGFTVPCLYVCLFVCLIEHQNGQAVPIVPIFFYDPREGILTEIKNARKKCQQSLVTSENSCIEYEKK